MLEESGLAGALFLVFRELFPVLAALYLIDGLTWVKSSQLLFSSLGGRRFRARGAGLRWVGGLPLDRAYSLSRLPRIVTSEGQYVPGSPRLEGAALYDPESWTLVPSQQRGEARAAERLGEAFDRIVEREKMFLRQTRWLRLLAVCLFLLSFVVFPVVLYLAAEGYRLMVPLVAVALLLYGSILGETARVAARLRRAGLAVTRKILLPMVLSPPAALHAVSHLSRELLAGFDTLAVSAALLSRATLLRLARAELHGIEQARSSGEEGGWTAYWTERRRQVIALLRRVGIEEREALAPPPRRDPMAAGYCPFCGTEYLQGFEACEDCRLPLLRFPRRETEAA